ncbi:MAG: ABC transporter permease [Sulfolobales archaeon]
MIRGGVYQRYNKALRSTIKILLRDRAGLVGLILILFFIALGTIGTLVINYDPKGNPAEIYMPPSLEHPLGTDFQGRDVFAQIVHGTPSVLQIAFLAGALTTLIAVLAGFAAGFLGGKVDTAIMGIADFVLTIPQIPLFAVLSALIRFSDISFLAILISSVSWPPLARAIRSQVLSIKEKEFIEASRILGFGVSEIVFIEIMPNIMPYIAVNLVFASINAIYAQVSLAYLGLVPFIGENWGIMLNRAWTFGAIFYEKSLLYIMAPIAAIVILQTGLILLSRAMEAIFNPRIRAE